MAVGRSLVVCVEDVVQVKAPKVAKMIEITRFAKMADIHYSDTILESVDFPTWERHFVAKAKWH